jgi:hypothetical protein
MSYCKFKSKKANNISETNKYRSQFSDQTALALARTDETALPSHSATAEQAWVLFAHLAPTRDGCFWPAKSLFGQCGEGQSGREAAALDIFFTFYALPTKPLEIPKQLSGRVVP